MHYFHVLVATVSFEFASYRVSERQNSLRVNITRAGNLQNTSVVLVASDNFQGTASGKLPISVPTCIIILLCV